MSGRVRRAYERVQASRYGWLWILLVAVMPTAIYWVCGYSGDDFEFHATSWVELHRAIAAHSWELGWSSGAQQGLGSPRLTLYPPVNVVVSTILSFLLPFRLVPGVVAWLILTTAGLSMYVTADRLIGTRHRLTTALFFMTSGYMLYAVIRRYDVAESWADALLPLTFLCYLRGVYQGQRLSRALWGLAFLLAFGWLANIPAAILTLYAFGTASVILCIARRRLRPVLLFAVAGCAALGLAAFRLAPTFLEKKWVSPQQLFRFQFRENLLFFSLPRHNVIFIFLDATLLITLALSIAARRQLATATGGRVQFADALLLIALVATFFQLPVSIAAWRYFPELSFAAFPWRFLAFLMPAVTLLLYAPGVSNRLRGLAALAWLPLAAFPFVSTFHELPITRFPNPARAFHNFETRYLEVPEYIPSAVPLDPLRVTALAMSPITGHVAGCGATFQERSPDRQQILTDSPFACRLVVGTFCYPFWRATLANGRPVPVECTTQGLIALALPTGHQQVKLSFRPHTLVRTASAWGSAAVLLLMILFEVFVRRRRKPIV